MTNIRFVLTGLSLVVASYAFNALITPYVMLLRRPGSFIPSIQNMVTQCFGGIHGWSIQTRNAPYSEVLPIQCVPLVEAKLSSKVYPTIPRHGNSQRLDVHFDTGGSESPTLRLDVETILQATDADGTDDSLLVTPTPMGIEPHGTVNVSSGDKDTTKRTLGATEGMRHTRSSNITTDITSMDKLAIGLLHEIYRYIALQGMWLIHDSSNDKLGFNLLEDSLVGIVAPLVFRFLEYVLNKEKYQLEWLIESLEHALSERMMYWRNVVRGMETGNDE